MILTLPGPTEARPSALDGIEAGARLVVYSAAWLAYARLGWRERSPRTADQSHDMAVYILSGFALSFFAFGLQQVLYQVADTLFGAGRSALYTPDRSAWIVWGSSLSWLLAGSAIWAAIWWYDLARAGTRLWRVVYLYLVLMTAVPTAMGSGIQGLYELLRRLFGYRPLEGQWVFLRDVLPMLIVSSAIWAYHWSVLRRQTAPAGDEASLPHGIAWPRRPAVALLTLLGMAIAVPALISLIWLGLDSLLGARGAVTSTDWWRERLSLGLAAGLVGSIAWFWGWRLLQQAAAANPAERTTTTRRLLLSTVVVINALASTGFTIALLWLVLRAVLGTPYDAGTVANALQYLSTAGITAVLGLYHGAVFRRDLQVRAARPRRVQITALVAPGTEELLAELRRRSGRPIEMAGYLTVDTADAPLLDVDALHRQLASLGMDDQSDAALLVLYAAGGAIFPYARGAAPPGSVPPGLSLSGR